MPVTRSHDNLLNIEEPANVSFTVDMGGGVASGRTRSSGRNNSIPVVESGDVGREGANSFRQLISESLNSFRGEMTEYITGELRSMFQNFGTPMGGGQTSASEGRSDTTPRMNDDGSREPFYAEKVLNIIRNWRLKFTGHDSQMTVEEFVYRVNTLTSSHLGGDFSLLCKHAHSLFDGKALDWFWRYHKRNNNLDWFSLTGALRNQYRDDSCDYELLEDIRRRKQKPNENIEEYLEIISAMTDRLKTPMTDRDLCGILICNLRSEIRHELLHLNIDSVFELRREVRKHEKFMLELRRSTKGRVSELSENKDDFTPGASRELDICAVRSDVKCWNCDKIGHTFFDCLEVRRIFCYGCGLLNVYKPTCPNCCKRTDGQGNLLKDVRRK